MFEIIRTQTAEATYRDLESRARASINNRSKNKKAKASPVEGLFKQVHKTLELLAPNPRHPEQQTHEFNSLPNPFNPKEKVFEAYAKNKTPGAYRVFWCYGSSKKQITIIAITPHP